MRIWGILARSEVRPCMGSQAPSDAPATSVAATTTLIPSKFDAIEN